MKIKNILLECVTASVIWLPFLPALILDVTVEIYHRICFPIYRIPTVKRSDYIILDRHKLKFLNIINKIDCMYCGYMNGILNYWKEIAHRTEKRFCPIKHERRKGFKEQENHKDFIPYGNKKLFLQSVRTNDMRASSHYHKQLKK